MIGYFNWQESMDNTINMYFFWAHWVQKRYVTFRALYLLKSGRIAPRLGTTNHSSSGKHPSGDRRWPSNPKKVRPSVRSLSNPRWTPKLSQPSSNRRTGSWSTWNYWLYTCIGIFGCGVKLKVQICPEAIHAPRFISKHRSSRPIHRYGWPQNHPYLFLSHSNLSTYVELT